MQNNNYKRKNAVESIEYRPKSGKYDTYLRGKRDEGVEIVSKKYAYIYHLDDEGYWTGLESVEAALAAAQEREPDAHLVFITETEEYVPRVWYDRVIDGLQEACDDECAGCYEGYLDDASERDKEALGDMLTATFVQWAKERGIKYWVDIPVAKKDVLYDLKTGKPVEEGSK
nr:MAG TPA: hypothetical protein [Caudoviricetes sp.]